MLLKAAEERIMDVGDTVTVHATGRRARIVSRISHERFQVEYLVDPDSDPVDRDTAQSEAEGGIYEASELQLAD
jgi:hypothetical protein